MYCNFSSLKKHLNITKLVYLFSLFGNEKFKRSQIPEIHTMCGYNPYFDDYAYYLVITGLLRHDSRGIYHVSTHPIIRALIRGEITRKTFIEMVNYAGEKYDNDYLHYLYETEEILKIFPIPPESIDNHLLYSPIAVGHYKRMCGKNCPDCNVYDCLGHKDL